MAKDFEKWNRDKQALHRSGDRPFYHAREIWWAALGVNIGDEVDGTGEHHDRPIVIIRPFNSETFFGVALIGHPRTGKFYFPLGQIGDREAVANLSQARLYDSKRLLRKIGTLEESTFDELCRALAITLFPTILLQ